MYPLSERKIQFHFQVRICSKRGDNLKKKKKDLKLPADFRPPCFSPLSGYPAVATYAVAKRAFTPTFAVKTERNILLLLQRKKMEREGEKGWGEGWEEGCKRRGRNKEK